MPLNLLSQSYFGMAMLKGFFEFWKNCLKGEDVIK